MQNCPIASEPHPQPFDWSFQKNAVRLPYKYYIRLKKRTYRLLQHHRDRFLCLSDFGVAFDLTIFGVKYNVLVRLVLWGSCIARLVAEGGQDLVFGSRQCWQNDVTSYAQRWGFSFVSILFINSCTNVFGAFECGESYDFFNASMVFRNYWYFDFNWNLYSLFAFNQCEVCLIAGKVRETKRLTNLIVLRVQLLILIELNKGFELDLNFFMIICNSYDFV